MTTILTAGDHFVLNSLLTDRLRTVAPDATFREITLPWPVEPFADVAEVREASGTEEQLIEALEGVDICVTQMAPLTERVLKASPDLRLFCVSRGGPVNANLEAATRHGVAVSFAPGRNATATAEHTVALMMAAARRVPATHADLADGTWRGDYYMFEKVGPELAGSTVGIVGYGAVGSQVARILQGFGAHVLVCDPFVGADAVAPAEVTDLADLMRRSLFVTVHARASAQTEGLISRQMIDLMPPGGVLVNCARGSLVDYDAVCDALDAERLFGAAFDVFPQEPIPSGARLLTTPHVVMTPHLAGASKQTALNAASITASEVARFLAGSPLAHCANPEVQALER
ncbi:2-hydroxyacid dehydrogenase [Streptomyces sp. RY43-2]|uniref:2-hydroxyacid dehydrogenase n=1 Tax=Streptomyces macrolidinus TaxID=2952607 RepID=A0ABT0ZD81_9ACTN|nr:2-hydroxyacid dehydrogenase [Streptomyces macrolidinus]MCN9241523.1 2-hydroxyacid dehydrogenase [Streptomyces macrolidinus]